VLKYHQAFPTTTNTAYNTLKSNENGTRLNNTQNNQTGGLGSKIAPTHELNATEIHSSAKQNQSLKSTSNETTNGTTVAKKPTTEGVVVVEKSMPVQSNGTIPSNQGYNNKTRTQNATTSKENTLYPSHNSETNNTATKTTPTATPMPVRTTTPTSTTTTTLATNEQQNKTVSSITNTRSRANNK